MMTVGCVAVDSLCGILRGGGLQQSPLLQLPEHCCRRYVYHTLVGLGGGNACCIPLFVRRDKPTCRDQVSPLTSRQRLSCKRIYIRMDSLAPGTAFAKNAGKCTTPSVYCFSCSAAVELRLLTRATAFIMDVRNITFMISILLLPTATQLTD